MKYMVDIDETSSKGKLVIDLLNEMGFAPVKVLPMSKWGKPSARKATPEEIKDLLSEAELSSSILLSEGIAAYKSKRAKK